MYCTLAEVRAEGVTEAQASDDRVTAAITLAGRYIDKVTGRFFEERNLTLTLDGDGDNTLLLPVPIVSVSVIEIGETEYDLDEFEVYNRLYPDDRGCPKIVFREGIFPEGNQNVEVTGVFGYLDTEGSGEEETRVTPGLIKRACLKLVIIDLLPELGDSDEQEELRRRYVTSETTDGHSYTLSELAVSGGASGDTEVDRILGMYRRPIGIWIV
jgi:hypothetical protein